MIRGSEFISHNCKLRDIMIRAFDDVYTKSHEYEVDMRTGAYIVAVNKVAEAIGTRGILSKGESSTKGRTFPFDDVRSIRDAN